MSNSFHRPVDLVGLAASAQMVRSDASVELRHQIFSRWAAIDAQERQLPTAQRLVCPLCQHSETNAQSSVSTASDQRPGAFGRLESYCIFGGGDLLRHVCPNCDLIFGPGKMLALSEYALAEEYEWHYRVYTEGDSTDQEIRAFHALEPQKSKRYLNWGAGGWSRTLNILRAQGWDVIGYEPHSASRGSRAGVISDWKQLCAMPFDGIFSNNVLEHFRHPVPELQQMASLLGTGGRMSHATPCFEYKYEFTRFHLFFYAGRSRELLARAAGLKLESFSADGDFMNMVLSRKSA